jgi:hypothetical protein
MNLADAIKQIFPDADFLNVIKLRDAGNGVYIETWLDPRPQPSIEELAAAYGESQKVKSKEALSEIAANKIALIFGKPAKSMDLIIKEMNLSNRCNELRHLAAAATLTAAEQAELDALNGRWNTVKAIREYEKQRALEADTADLTTFDINFGWPE